MLSVLFRYWWVLLVRGILAILFGIAAFVWPAITLTTLVLLFGAYVFVNGAFLIINAVGSRKEKEDWWLLLIEGLLGIGIGLMTAFAPGITGLALLLYIAAWALAAGILEIIAAIRLRKVVTGEWWLAVGGVVSIIFALLLMRFPAAGALGFVWLIAGYACVFGAIMIVLGLKVHRLGEKLHMV
ncbi:MAG TPA: HdeD family acid-resistance protein [Nitrospirota bacterium]|nr:HdeD family acid-resistance protein [Nitrospirota bacterium]